MKILKNVCIIAVTVLLSYFLAVYVGGFYENFSGDSGSYVDVRFFSGFPLTYIFFLSLLFTTFGDKHKYWWIGILLIPAFWFEIYFDLPHLYFPLALGLLGWLIGLGLRKLFSGSV